VQHWVHNTLEHASSAVAQAGIALSLTHLHALSCLLVCMISVFMHADVLLFVQHFEGYDPEGFSMWLCDYKYNDENTVNYVVMNKVSACHALQACAVNIPFVSLQTPSARTCHNLHELQKAPLAQNFCKFRSLQAPY